MFAFEGCENTPAKLGELRSVQAFLEDVIGLLRGFATLRADFAEIRQLGTGLSCRNPLKGTDVVLERFHRRGGTARVVGIGRPPVEQDKTKAQEEPVQKPRFHHHLSICV